MADDKDSSGLDGHAFAFQFLGLAVIVMVLGTVLERKGMTNFLDLTPQEDQQIEIESSSDLENDFLQSELSLGDYTTNIDPLIVRQSPGGAPVGRQDEGIKGRLVEGPVERFDTTWWRVDYPEAPDGWVEGEILTTNRALYFGLNFIPITFGFLRPIGIIATIIITILLIVVILKNKEVKKAQFNKAKVKADQEIYKKGHEEKDSDKNFGESSDENQGEDFSDADLPVPGLPIGEKPKTQKPSNRRWENIQSLINSYNSNDWKQAIIEADTILDEMVQKMGYKGKSLGERLKQVEQSDFTSINQAWEAHKTRNRIAHSGSNYVLSKDEAERIINLYKQVFAEFYYI